MGNQECIRCILSTKEIPNLKFDDKGLCEQCIQHDQFVRQYPTGFMGLNELRDIFQKIRKDGMKKDFDCVVGLSGGCDSSFVLHLAKTMGLNPLAVNYDNGWDTDIAKNNIQKMCSKLRVPLLTYKPDTYEVEDVWRAFIMSGAPDVEAVTDLALTKCLYMACEKHNIKYILNGHSFRTEGWVPKGMSYMDGRYVRDVHKRFGAVSLSTLPQLTLWDMIKYPLLLRVKRVRPLYYIDYNPTRARELLKDLYGWEWYGGKHLENKFTAWFGAFYRVFHSNFDSRIIHMSALIRSGFVNRNDAKQHLDYGIKGIHKTYGPLVELRLGISHERMIEYTNAKEVPVDEFKTYKKHFKVMKPLFYLAYKLSLIPKTFYLKYVK